jgi:hypothetical protein
VVKIYKSGFLAPSAKVVQPKTHERAQEVCQRSVECPEDIERPVLYFMVVVKTSRHTRPWVAVLQEHGSNVIGESFGIFRGRAIPCAVVKETDHLKSYVIASKALQKQEIYIVQGFFVWGEHPKAILLDDRLN